MGSVQQPQHSQQPQQRMSRSPTCDEQLAESAEGLSCLSMSLGSSRLVISLGACNVNRCACALLVALSSVEVGEWLAGRGGPLVPAQAHRRVLWHTNALTEVKSQIVLC